MTCHLRLSPASVLLVLVLTAGIIAGCTFSAGSSAAHQQSATSTPAIISSPVERVEVYHFHGNHQCASCIAVGDLAEKTVNTNFKDELATGRLVFGHINVDLPENSTLAEKYGVTGSSLWIGIYDRNGFHNEQDIRVWYLINNKDAFSSYLSGIISKRLNGNLA